MARSSGTPIEFKPKHYYIAAALAAAIAILSLALALARHTLFSVFVGIFWAVISVLAIRAARRGAA